MHNTGCFIINLSSSAHGSGPLPSWGEHFPGFADVEALRRESENA
jgi:hypothetical protein